MESPNLRPQTIATEQDETAQGINVLEDDTKTKPEETVNKKNKNKKRYLYGLGPVYWD